MKLGALNIAEASKNACLYPNRYLDDACYGCDIYEICGFGGKYKPEDWKKKNTRNEVIIKKLDTN